LFRLLQEAVAARTGQPPASITEGVLDVELPRCGVPAETIGALHELFQACNQARYAPSSTPPDLDALGRTAAAACSALRSAST
jgi:hypothetical protein